MTTPAPFYRVKSDSSNAQSLFDCLAMLLVLKEKCSDTSFHVATAPSTKEEASGSLKSKFDNLQSYIDLCENLSGERQQDNISDISKIIRGIISELLTLAKNKNNDKRGIKTELEQTFEDADFVEKIAEKLTSELQNEFKSLTSDEKAPVSFEIAELACDLFLESTNFDLQDTSWRSTLSSIFGLGGIQNFNFNGSSQNVVLFNNHGHYELLLSNKENQTGTILDTLLKDPIDTSESTDSESVASVTTLSEDCSSKFQSVDSNSYEEHDAPAPTETTKWTWDPAQYGLALFTGAGLAQTLTGLAVAVGTLLVAVATAFALSRSQSNDDIKADPYTPPADDTPTHDDHGKKPSPKQPDPAPQQKEPYTPSRNNGKWTKRGPRSGLGV